MSVYASKNDKLYTFNALVPESEWTQKEGVAREMAESFKLVV